MIQSAGLIVNQCNLVNKTNDSENPETINMDQVRAIRMAAQIIDGRCVILVREHGMDCVHGMDKVHEQGIDVINDGQSDGDLNKTDHDAIPISFSMVNHRTNPLRKRKRPCAYLHSRASASRYAVGASAGVSVDAFDFARGLREARFAAFASLREYDASNMARTWSYCDCVKIHDELRTWFTTGSDAATTRNFARICFVVSVEFGFARMMSSCSVLSTMVGVSTLRERRAVLVERDISCFPFVLSRHCDDHNVAQTS